MAETPSGRIRSLDQGMEIIGVLAAESRGLSVADIARQLGFNLSTTHHLVATLRRRGFLDQDPEIRAYRLGHRLVSVVDEFVSESDIYAVGAGPIRELRDASGDTSGKTLLAHLPDEQRRALIAEMTLTRFTPHTITTPREFEAVLTAIRTLGYVLDRAERSPDTERVA